MTGALRPHQPPDGNRWFKRFSKRPAKHQRSIVKACESPKTTSQQKPEAAHRKRYQFVGLHTHKRYLRSASARPRTHQPMLPPEKPLPRPQPKPPKPKLPKPERKLKPKPKPQPEPERDQIPFGVPLPPDPFACAADCSESCAFYHLCPPPPPPSSRAATVHLRSSRLPTPLIALSASLLVVSVILLIALLVYRMVRQRRRQTAPQEAPLTQHEEEGVPVPDVAVEGEDAGDSGVHHVWYIRTVGLDERAIAAITALVYDAKKCGGGVGLGGGGDDGSCAVCLAEFRDGETLRLLPRCGHAFHRGCIDTWLSAHVNCPLCRAPVQVADQAASANAALGAATAAPGGEPAANNLAAGGAGTEEADGDGALPERAVRRAASMVALPRRAWPGVSLRAPASNSGREGEMSLAKISRQLKFSEALEMAGIGAGRSFSFGAASCLRLPGRYGPSAAGINTDEMSR